MIALSTTSTYLCTNFGALLLPADGDDDDASNVVAIANGEATAAEKNAGAIVQTKVCHGYNQFNSLLTHQSSCSLQLSTYFYLRTIPYDMYIQSIDHTYSIHKINITVIFREQ